MAQRTHPMERYGIVNAPSARSEAWVSWGAPVELRAPARPPTLRHAQLVCCARCSDALPERERCTTDIEAVWRASDEELRRGTVAGCVKDRDDELERRIRERHFGVRRGPTPTTRKARR